MLMFLITIAIFIEYFIFKNYSKIKLKSHDTFTSLASTSLLRAWVSSLAWSLVCIGSCILLRRWADAHGAFSSGTEGRGHLILLTLAVLVSALLFHTQAYKKFQYVYLARSAIKGQALAVTWLLILSLMRISWIVFCVIQTLLLLLSILIGDNTNSSWG